MASRGSPPGGEFAPEDDVQEPQSLLALSRSLVSSRPQRTPLQLTTGPAPTREKRIRVCVRVRPFTKNEALKAGGKAAWTWHGNTIYQQIFPAMATSRKTRDKSPTGQSAGADASGSSNAHLPSSYSFDYLYGATSQTSQLYDDSVRDSIVAALEGYHSSVFVYGQTGTGKTHTMLGSRSEPGLIQLAVEDIFDHIAQHAESEFLLRFSYLEIYNEKVYDLLAAGARSDIKIYEVARKDVESEREVYVCNDVIIKGLTEEIVVSVDHVLSLVEAGNFHRHTSSTEANDQSSRSHTIFRLVIESQAKHPDQGGSSNGLTASVLRSATLNLIDLAGSESVRLANTSGQALEEGRHINRSLLTLGHIIWKLSRASSKSSLLSGDAQPQHLPYRNSKLTRILQPALGGKAQITIVCTIAPSVECLAETHNTLKFATRARRVKSRLSMNESAGESALLKKYRNRIKVLQDEWNDLELHKSSDDVSPADVATIEARQVELQFAIENINRVILNSSHRQGIPDPVNAADGSNIDDDEGDEDDEEEDDELEEELDREASAKMDGDQIEDKTPTTPQSERGRAMSPFTRNSSSSSIEPESESSLASSAAALRRNLSLLSDESARSQRRSSLMTVLKAKYVAELNRLESGSQPNSNTTTATTASTSSNNLNLDEDLSTLDTMSLPPLSKGSSQRELLREFVRGLELAEAENDTRMSQIRELELENQYLRELLRERDEELAALRE